MKIFAGHDESGCAWYRVLMPLGELANHGHQVTMVSANLSQGGGATRETMAEHDVVVAQRWDSHAGLGTWRRLKATSKLVYETDDDVFSVEPVNWPAYSQFAREDVRDAVRHSLEVADLVTVSTAPLAEVMREHNPNVAVLPNMVPAMVLDLPAPAGDRPAIGWHGGASHGLDIQVVGQPLRRFLDKHPGWDAVLFGQDYRPTVRHERCGYIPWLHVNDNPAGFYGSLDWDIGLAPVQYTEFNKSKSYIKCLEYAARGIPVIATDIEPYREFVLHGVTGFLVKGDHEWFKYMCELAADEGLRQSMGEKAKEHARQFTIEGNWRRWEDAYRKLLPEGVT